MSRPNAKNTKVRGGQKGGSGKKVAGSGTVPWRFRHGSGEKATGSGALSEQLQPTTTPFSIMAPPI